MSADQGLHVRVPQDRSRAVLVLQGAEPPELVTEGCVADAAQRAGVTLHASVLDRIREAVAAYASNPGPMEFELARARPARPGTDGGFVWEPAFDPDVHVEIPQDGSVDHYAGRRLVQVKPGDVVARLRSPEDGEDGRDVAGGVIKARPGVRSRVTPGHGLSVDSGGRVIADIAGVLDNDGTHPKIVEHLQVSGDVGFATGHIDFAGAVTIAGGVKPCLVVKAAGDVCIGGLVEDASTICGGSLDCRRGMTAKTRGEVQTGGALHAVFLNSIHGTVGGVLAVHREVMNCVLEVRGDVRSPRAAVLGGKLVAHGHVELNDLGSPNWKETDLVLAWTVRAGMDARIAEIKAEAGRKREQFEQIRALGKRATPTQRELLTELEFQLWELEQELGRRTAELRRHMESAAAPASEAARSVVVHRAIHPKVRVHLAGDTVTFTVPVRGPVRITLDHRDRLVARVGEEAPVLLAELAQGVGARRAA